MRDSEIVASIVAGDPQGLATAYDRYATPLYTYCRTVLRDQSDAADAVQDTFVIAAQRLEGLRDPDKLRSWLYAVARNECMRILRAGSGTSGLDEAPDVIDHSVDIGADAERAELSALFRDASEGLNANEREVIELSLRHKMEAGEIAGVLGVSSNHAHSLLSRARGQLEACLGALLVGRAGRADCKELTGLLGEWDGKLTILLRKRLHRHIENCDTCTKRRAFELRPAAFFGLPPLVAVAGTLRMFGMPAAIKVKVLALATGTGAADVAQRAAILRHAGSFTHQGFPHAAHGAQAGALHGAGAKTGAFLKTPQGQGTAAAVVVAAVAASAAFALTGNTGHVPLADSRPSHSAGGGSGASGGGGGGNGGGGAPAGNHSSSPSTDPKSAAAKPGSKPGTNPAVPGGTSQPSVATSVPGTLSGSTPAGSPVPTTTGSTPAPSPTGTLTASPATGFLTVPPGGTTITLTNTGSTMAHWTMTVSGGTGTVTVAPAAGSLAPGKSTTVTVTTTSGAAVAQTITLAPGGTTWTVLFGYDDSATGGALPGLGILPSVRRTPATPAPSSLPSASPSCTVYAIVPNSACP